MTSDTVYGFFTAHVDTSTYVFRDRDLVGYICIRLDRPSKDSDSNKYKASFAFCSPFDAPKDTSGFNRQFRALSRKIADDRMLTTRKKCYIEFEFNKNEQTNLYDIFEFAVNKLNDINTAASSDLKIPRWFFSSQITRGLPNSKFKNVPTSKVDLYPL